MSENTSDDEQIPMADEDLEENSSSQVSTNSVRSAPQEVTATILTNLPVLESLSPRYHSYITQLSTCIALKLI